jgi:hypothetical protein
MATRVRDTTKSFQDSQSRVEKLNKQGAQPNSVFRPIIYDTIVGTGPAHPKYVRYDNADHVSVTARGMFGPMLGGSGTFTAGAPQLERRQNAEGHLTPIDKAFLYNTNTFGDVIATI